MSNLNSNDEVYGIIKTPRAINAPEALPDWKQKIFFELHGLSGIEYQDKKNEAKIRWDMKIKLSSE